MSVGVFLCNLKCEPVGCSLTGWLSRERFDYTNSSSHFYFSERLEPGGWFGRTLSLTNTFRLLKNKILPQSQCRAPYLVQLGVSPVQRVETFALGRRDALSESSQSRYIWGSMIDYEQ